MAEDAAEAGASGATGDAIETGIHSDGDGDGPDADEDANDAYDGLFGAFPYAFRSSDSVLFRTYVVVGGLAALATGLLFTLALVVLIGETIGGGGGQFSFVRAFFVFVGMLVVAPLIAPVLFVARRIRRGHADRRFAAVLAGLGYGFLGSLYLGALISAPATQQTLPSNPLLSAVVAGLYDLPRLAGLAPPLVVAGAMAVVARRW
ncbi:MULTISPECIES: hypothetical protein [Halomicrobium]|uniref:DUF8056 domain-containing protein n=2 Tax=Halomicrobium mukohataei TaxID=57705 RepID=C7P2W8_HALMD|nr:MULTISPECIES: hypothetical protein [Halomicrobium]ACV47440.1 hypothetical protein Hmuk_1319 [Halomicrobium mukohataei DSM 12286]QCD65904.1 hypothetical protein E5139_09755 [Halomicrobium mukohataei]QFR20709.1 hypothetical protein GBQ70_09750 [Halomicrobium sp. ZPS1]